MKTLRHLLNKTFTLLALCIFIVVLAVEYIALSLTIDQHKKRATESTKLIADYFETTLLFESEQDFDSLVKKLNFKDTYHSISLNKEDGSVFAFRGEVPQIGLPNESFFKGDLLISSANVVSSGKVIGSVHISFYINELKQDIYISGFIIILSFVLLGISFYLYIKKMNQTIISPIKELINAIYTYESKEDDINIGNINSKVSEIFELKENFSNLILQINFSRKQLEQWNKNLEEKIKDKTKKLEFALDETKKYQKKIIAQEKLASLGGLSAGIAHEIKNPLNLIINSSQLVTMKLDSIKELLSSERDKDEILNSQEFKEELKEIDEICEIINSSGTRADRIIKGMLSQARSQSSKKEIQNLADICRQGLNLAYHSMRAKEDAISVEIIEDIESEIHYNCYFEEIERAIINLVDNSFDALKEKKYNNEEFKPCLNLTLKRVDQSIQIIVRDNGPGIPKSLLEKVKEPFFTTKPTGKGTGLGISMINDIVTSQSGELDIHSVEGEFTEIKIILPDEKNLEDKAS